MFSRRRRITIIVVFAAVQRENTSTIHASDAERNTRKEHGVKQLQFDGTPVVTALDTQRLFKNKGLIAAWKN